MQTVPIGRGLSLSQGYAMMLEERQMGKVVRKSHGRGDRSGMGGMDGTSQRRSSGLGGRVRVEQSRRRSLFCPPRRPRPPPCVPPSILPQRWLNE